MIKMQATLINGAWLLDSVVMTSNGVPASCIEALDFITNVVDEANSFPGRPIGG
jgi:hypothetical protein